MTTSKFLKRAARSAVVLACLLLAACGSDKPPSVTISGQITYPSDRALPEGAMSRISVFQENADNGDRRIVAERTLHNVRNKPIDFKLDIARNLVQAPGDYRIRAEIIDNDGDTLWESGKAATLDPSKDGQSIALKLEQAATDPSLVFQKYRCGDSFHLVAATSDDEAVVRLGNRRLTLDADKNEGHYSDEHDNRLVVEDQNVRLRIDGNEHPNCQPVAEHKPAPVNAQTEPNKKSDGTTEPSESSDQDAVASQQADAEVANESGAATSTNP